MLCVHELIADVCIQVQDKLDKMAGSHGPTLPNTPRSSFDTRASGGRHRDEHRPRAEELYEIVCNDVVLPLDMTLAAVRQFVWRQAGELSMYYRRKTVHPHPHSHAHPPSPLPPPPHPPPHPPLHH